MSRGIGTSRTARPLPSVTVARAVVLLGLAAVAFLVLSNYNTQEIQEGIRHTGAYAPLVFVAVCVLKPLLVVLPSMGLTVIAGVLFGPLYGTLYVALGGAGSTVVGFYWARWLGRDFAEKVVGRHEALLALHESMQAEALKTVLTLRLLNLPWDLVSYWAGAAGVPFKEFYIASLIPLLPVSFLYTYFGSTLSAPASRGFMVSLLAILALAVASRWWRKRNRARPAQRAPAVSSEGKEWGSGT